MFYSESKLTIKFSVIFFLSNTTVKLLQVKINFRLKYMNIYLPKLTLASTISIYKRLTHWRTKRPTLRLQLKSKIAMHISIHTCCV